MEYSSISANSQRASGRAMSHIQWQSWQWWYSEHFHSKILAVQTSLDPSQSWFSSFRLIMWATWHLYHHKLSRISFYLHLHLVVSSMTFFPSTSFQTFYHLITWLLPFGTNIQSNKNIFFPASVINWYNKIPGIIFRHTFGEFDSKNVYLNKQELSLDSHIP